MSRASSVHSTLKGSGLRNRSLIALFLGLLMGAAAGLFLGTPAGRAFEESAGLRWLFTLRGPLPAPEDVVVVHIDRAAAARLGLPPKARNWRRYLYGCLVERLTRAGAALIVFDMGFYGPSGDAARYGPVRDLCTAPTGPGRDDAVFADALRRSGRVVLLQHVLRERLSGLRPVLVREHIRSPLPPLATAALAQAPWPLPKDSDRVSYYMPYARLAGELLATLPVVSLHAMWLQGLKDLPDLWERAGLAQQDTLTTLYRTAREQGDLGPLLAFVRAHIQAQPGRLDRLRGALSGADGLRGDDLSLLHAVLRLPAREHRLYLNYYGPAGSLPMIPIDAVLGAASVEGLGLQGKAVFVGVAELGAADQQDGFYTVYTRDDGVDLSGVEIAATAFANLVHDQALHPISGLTGVAITLIVGVLAATLACLLPGSHVGDALLGLGALYLALAQLLFAEAVWVPVAIPLLETVIALPLGLLFQFLVARREREAFDRAIRFYIPGKEAERIVHDGCPSQVPCLVYGTCLMTDVQGFTTLSEQTDPLTLATLSNEYFGLLGEQIAAQGGQMLEIAGDGMTCIWAAAQRDRGLLRMRACRAAIRVLAAVGEFNRRHPDTPFPTRIGLHAGWLAEGNIGGGGHLVYGLVGDIANTASRVEGLNKYLGTWLLATDEVVQGLDALVTRRVGAFILKGKERALSVYEILGDEETAVTKTQRDLCRLFDQALQAFDAGRWAQAGEGFQAILSRYPGDGPSAYYLALCKEYAATPGHAPIVRLNAK